MFGLNNIIRSTRASITSPFHQAPYDIIDEMFGSSIAKGNHLFTTNDEEEVKEVPLQMRYIGECS